MDTRGVRGVVRGNGRPIRLSSEPRARWASRSAAWCSVTDGGLFATDGRRRMKTIEIPELALVALIGASGSGKSTLAQRHFLPTEVLSSDFFRGLVSDDEGNQEATADAFAALHFVAGRRLANQRLTIVDATNVQAESTKPLVA